MAAVDTVTNVTGPSFIPGVKVFQATASDGETFVKHGLSRVDNAFATYASDPSTGNPIGVTKSGTTLTIECTSMSDAVIYIYVMGA